MYYFTPPEMLLFKKDVGKNFNFVTSYSISISLTATGKGHSYSRPTIFYNCPFIINSHSNRFYFMYLLDKFLLLIEIIEGSRCQSMSLSSLGKVNWLSEANQSRNKLSQSIQFTANQVGHYIQSSGFFPLLVLNTKSRECLANLCF